MRIFFAFSMLLFLFAACATPQGGYQTDPAVMLSDAQTAVARATGTQQAAIAATYEANMQATATAVAYQNQTRAAAEATAVAVTATHEAISGDLAFEATRMALNAIAGEQTRAHQATVVALDAIARAEEALLRDHEAELANRRRQEEIALKRQEVWVWAAPALWFVIIAGLTFLGVQFFAWLKNRDRVVVQTVNGHEIPFTIGNNVRVLPGRAISSQLALPSGDEVEPVISFEAARWDRLMAWNRPVEIPLGVQLGSPNRPALLVDRNREPHVLAAGTSGSGKSTAFLLPYTLAMWAQNAHILVVNAKGSDFTPLRGAPNMTFIPNLPAPQLIPLLVKLLDALKEEGDRRDEVLARHNARSWRDLPASAGESGEILIVIDEFLALVESAGIWALQVRQDADLSNAERKLATDEISYLVASMWAGLNNVARVCRKHGIHLAVTMTDPTSRGLGDAGMALRRQCLALAFPMRTAAASRAFVEVERGDGFNRGSVGLGTGQFLVNMNGNIYHVAGYNPSPQDLRTFRDVKAGSVRPFALPGGLAVDEAIEGEYVERPTASASPPPPRNNMRGLQTQWGMVTAEQVGRILELRQQGHSHRAIEIDVFGYPGGTAYHMVEAVYQSQTHH
jgi:hypothetical protein